MNNYQLACFKKTDCKMLGDDNDLFELSMHKMDTEPGELIVWALSAPFPDDGGYQFRSHIEKECLTKFMELLGHDVISPELLKSMGFRDELHTFDFENDYILSSNKLK